MNQKLIKILYIKRMFSFESNLFTGTTRPFSKKMIDQYFEKITSGDSSRVDLVIVRQKR